jgi:hypothetical protein
LLFSNVDPSRLQGAQVDIWLNEHHLPPWVEHTCTSTRRPCWPLEPRPKYNLQATSHRCIGTVTFHCIAPCCATTRWTCPARVLLYVWWVTRPAVLSTRHPLRALPSSSGGVSKAQNPLNNASNMESVRIRIRLEQPSLASTKPAADKHHASNLTKILSANP